MKSSVDTVSETRVKLTVEIPFDEIGEDVARAYREIGQQVNIPGFRRGKVPSRIIDQRFGRGVVLEEVVNKVVPRAYDDAVRENELRPLGQPDVEVTEIEDGDKISFTAELDVVPDFDLPDYKGLAVQVSESTVSDEAVAEQLENLRKRFATNTPVERAATEGDLVLVDVAGSLDGEELEQFTGSALTFEVGAEGMIDGFSEAVVGASEGDTVTFAHTPDEGDYAGQTVDITVEVNGVRERTLPEVDDEFAQLASEFDTVAELRDDLRQKLSGSRLAEQGYEAREKLGDMLIDMVEMPMPEAFLAAQVEEHFHDGHGDDEHRAEVAENSRKALKSQLILDAIADAEELQVEQGELLQWLVQQAPQYGMSPDQFAQTLADNGQVPVAMADVRRGKALAFVLQNATITDESGNTVDLSLLDEPSEPSIEDIIEQMTDEVEELDDADETDDEELEDDAAESDEEPAEADEDVEKA